MQGSGPSPGGYSGRSMTGEDDYTMDPEPLRPLNGVRGGGRAGGGGGGGARDSYFATYGHEKISGENETASETRSSNKRDRDQQAAGNNATSYQHHTTATATATTTQHTKRVTINDEEVYNHTERRHMGGVVGEPAEPILSKIQRQAASAMNRRAPGAEGSNTPRGGPTGEVVNKQASTKYLSTETSEMKGVKSGGGMTQQKTVTTTTTTTTGNRSGGAGGGAGGEGTGTTRTTTTVWNGSSSQPLHPAEVRRAERWAEEERRQQSAAAAQARARAQVPARQVVADMAGKSLTVVKHALAPLGGGGKNQGGRLGGGKQGDGGKQPSPLAAVWAIVQAYAIVALVCTVYNTVFGNAADHSKVPDEVQGILNATQGSHQATASGDHAAFAGFGEGVLSDVSNLNSFLGVSSSTYHFTRLSCRKTIDSVYGTGAGIKYGASAAGHTALNFLTPGAQEVAQQLMLPDAWAKIKATSKFTWRGIVNCSFLTWTVLKPGVLVLIPLWDFVWDGIEPVLVRIKDSVVDGVDDAMFTFEEAFSEAMGPTVAGWKKTFGPVARIPGNVYRGYLSAVWRPAVFFCTYPELFGNLKQPVRPEVKRLRWGEKCRPKLWGEWTECSVRCGDGYMARENHCGTRQVSRCTGPGIIGCDEECDSGAVTDCAGRCNGDAVKDCGGVCGGGAEFGCDGKCADPPSEEDDAGECCISPTFRLPSTGLCNTTLDEESEMLAEARRLKEQLGSAKEKLAKGEMPARDKKNARAARKNAKAPGKKMSAEEEAEELGEAAAAANKKAGYKAWKKKKMSPDDDDDGDGDDEPETMGEEEAAARDEEEKAKSKKMSFGNAARAVSHTVAENLAPVVMAPLRLLLFLLRIIFSRVVIFTVLLGALTVGLHHVITTVVAKMQKDLEAEEDADAAGSDKDSDRGSDKSSIDDGSFESRVRKTALASLAVAKEWWEKFLKWKKEREEASKARALQRKLRAKDKSWQQKKKSQETAATKAAEEERRRAEDAARAREREAKEIAAAAAATAAAGPNKPPSPKSPMGQDDAERFEDERDERDEVEEDAAAMNPLSRFGNVADMMGGGEKSDRRSAGGGKYRSGELMDHYAARKRALYAIVAMSGDESMGWKSRLRCFAALVRLANTGSNRAYLMVEMGALEEATNALLLWIKNRNLQGPDSALQLLRVLLNVPSTQHILSSLPSVKRGESAMALLEVLQATPGVLAVQRNGLSSMWALVKCAGPKSGVAEGLVRAGLYEHLEDEWEDSYEDFDVAHGVAGCVMQLALGNKTMQAVLTNMGAQGLITRVLDQHDNLEFQGKFSGLREWLRERPPESPTSDRS